MEDARPYYRDLNYRPFLFYVVFGVRPDPLEVSRQRHHVDELPAGLELVFFDRESSPDAMDSLLGGAMGRVLEAESPRLYRAARETGCWTILRGEARQDADLRYLRNAVGFVQALAEKGAAAVLDLLTLRLYAPDRWEKEVFSAPFDPFAHAVILSSSMEDGTVWLHTRGMCKFGRPDISLTGVPPEETVTAARVVNQMIFYGAQGLFFTGSARLHLSGGVSCVVAPEFVSDFDNLDFNNAYYRLDWTACRLETEEIRP